MQDIADENGSRMADSAGKEHLPEERSALSHRDEVRGLLTAMLWNKDVSGSGKVLQPEQLLPFFPDTSP